MFVRIMPAVLFGFTLALAAAGPARAQLDRSPAQVTIEPRFVTVERSFDRPAFTMFGLLGGGGFGARSLSEIGGNFDGRIAGASAFAGGGGAEATLFTFGNIARPLGGVELQARVNVDVFSARNQQVTQNGSATGTVDRSQTNFLAGPQLRTMLVVTPQINLDGFVYMQVGAARVSVSGEPVNGVALGGTDTAFAMRAGAGIDAPIGGFVRLGIEYAYQHTASVNPDRSPLFLNGQFREGSSDAHIVMARIAFVGALFRADRRDRQRRDLMIMVTPRLVQPIGE